MKRVQKRYKDQGRLCKCPQADLIWVRCFTHELNQHSRIYSCIPNSTVDIISTLINYITRWWWLDTVNLYVKNSAVIVDQ